MAHYYVVAERDDGRTWWFSFPHGAGIRSAADDAADIPAQARDALESAMMHSPADLPHPIEDAAMPPTAADLAEFAQPASRRTAKRPTRRRGARRLVKRRNSGPASEFAAQAEACRHCSLVFVREYPRGAGR
jgi:hypothetical protein